MVADLPGLPEVAPLVRREKGEPLGDRHLEMPGDWRVHPEPGQVEPVRLLDPADQLLLELEEPGHDLLQRLVRFRLIELRALDAHPDGRLHEANVEVSQEAARKRAAAHQTVGSSVGEGPVETR